MFVDAREIPPETQFDCDVVVIGAGAGGIPAAYEFLRSSHDVILLESGGFHRESKTQALYKGEVVDPAHHGPLDKYRRRSFGGTTTVWGGRCAPYDAIDFERREHVPYSGWPISRQDMDPYYERAHVYCDAGRYTYDASAALPGANSPMIPGLVSDDVSQEKIWRFSLPTNFAKVS